MAQLMSICESCSSFGEALPRVLPDLSTSEAYELVVQHYQPLYEAMDRQAPHCTGASLYYHWQGARVWPPGQEGTQFTRLMCGTVNSRPAWAVCGHPSKVHPKYSGSEEVAQL